MTSAGGKSEIVTFPWRDTGDQLSRLIDREDLVLDERGAFSSEKRRFVPPLVLPIGANATPTSYLDALPDRLGSHLVLLLQAGAAALGWWDDEELELHKVIRKYVVRGKGRAQPTHLKTRGKSRYGSRLRLQNARRLLDDVIERQRDWLDARGEPELAFRSCPVRLWADLYQVRPAPPLPRERFTKIPLDVRTPSLRELERVYRSLSRGRIERLD